MSVEATPLYRLSVAVERAKAGRHAISDAESLMHEVGVRLVEITSVLDAHAGVDPESIDENERLERAEDALRQIAEIVGPR